MPAPIAQVLNDRYEVLRPLGHGGMGAVYLVFDRQEARQVALKSFPPTARRVEDLAHFEHEFLTLSRLRHPNVAEVYDFGVIEGTHDVFFTSEFIDGKDLFEVTAGLPEAELAALLVQVCRGLAYVHSREIIHYDVKPTNILVTRRNGAPQVKLIDFGLAARKVDDALGVIKGTVSYLAPELARHLPVDHRADLYSLGVTMFHCVTRSLPFRGETNLDVVRKVVSDAPPDPSEARPDLSRGLRELILRLLSKDPGSRPQTGNEVIRALAKVLGRDFETEPMEATLTFIASGGFFGRERELSALTGAFDRIFSWHDAGDPLSALPAPDGPVALAQRSSLSGTGFVITTSGTISTPGSSSGPREAPRRPGDAFGFALEPDSRPPSGQGSMELAAPAPEAAPAAAPEEGPIPHVALIAGEAGVGKSRLLRELKTHAQLRRAAVVEGRATGGAYAPFVEVFRGVLGLWPDDAAARAEPGRRAGAAQDALRKRLLGRYGAELVRLIPDLDSSALPATPRPALAPAQDELRLLDALAQFLIGYSRIRPLVVLLHDLERADVETLELLRYLARNLALIESTRALARRAHAQQRPGPGGPLAALASPPPGPRPQRLMVVLSYRPSELLQDGPLALAFAALREEPVVTTIALEPLGPEQVYALVESMLGAGSEPRALARRIWEETSGNPYFAVELMRSLVESGALVRQDGRWVAKLEERGALAIPAGVAEVILERTRRISKDERGPLELLAVLGREASIHELAALGGDDARDVVARLGALERRQVLRGEHRGEAGRRWDFIHDVARRAIYEAIPAERRAALHAACGAWLEERSGLGRGAVDPGELVRHFSAAGDRKRALEYGVRAGDEARAVHANHRAIELFQGALALLPAGSARWRGLLTQVADLLAHTGDDKGALDVYDSLLRPPVEATLGPAERVRAWRRRGELLERRGDFDGALDDLSQGSAAAFGQDGLERECASLFAATASIYARTGRYADALGFCDAALGQLSGLADGDEAAQVHAVLGRARLALGEPAEAEREFERCLAIRRRQGDDAGQARALADLGAVALEAGRTAEAADRFERALERETALGHAAGIAEAATRLSLACRALGQQDRAAALLRQALGLHEKSGARAEAVAALTDLGRLMLAQGEYAQALDPLRRAHDDAVRLGMRAVTARALNAEASMYARLGQRAKAHELASEALRQASLQGDAPRERAAALETLGLVLAAQGEVDRGEQLLHEAQALFRAQKDAPGVLRTTLGVLDILLAQGDAELARATLGTVDEVGLADADRALLLHARARAGLLLEPAPAAPARASLPPATLPGGPLADLSRALALAQTARDRELVWRVQHLRGRLLERNGDIDAALQALVSAMTVLRELMERVPGDLRGAYVQAPERVACREDFLRIKGASSGS